MIKNKIEKILKKAIEEKDIEIELVAPEKKEFGHYSTPLAMKIARARISADKTRTNAEKISPMEIARQITNNLRPATNNFFERIEIAEPGFINFWVAPEAIQNEVKEIYEKGQKFGKGKTEKDKRMVIDYCGVNIAKPMSIGHLRSTIIGQALYNIFKFSGYKVIGDNHLGDWGKQFGVLIASYKEIKKAKSYKLKANKLSIEDLMEMYVDYSRRMKENPELEKIAKEETKKLQNNDKKNVKIWKEFHKITFAELNKIFKLLDVKINYHLGESFYKPMLKSIVQNALKKKIAIISEGATVIFLNKNEPPLIIQKSDEAYLYSTTDIATIKYRVKKFKPNLILYVVGNEQSLHLKQVFEAARKLGYIEAKKREYQREKNMKEVKLEHIKFGLILSEDMRKLSTRAGRHISLLEVINEAIKRAKKIVDEKRSDLPEKEKQKIAKVVGIGALKYNDLSQNRQSDISFNWDKMLNLEGNSGPYIQYTYARLRSILRKAKPKNHKLQPTTLKEEIELELILKLDEFPDVIQKITETYYPHYLAEYLYKLAREANDFYHRLPVLKTEKGVKEARLVLIDAISKTLKTGLNLLGIRTIDKI